VTRVLTALRLPSSKRRIDSEPQANAEREFIEISSDEESSESKDEVKRENQSTIYLKKRTLSNSASGPPTPPSRRRITLDTIDTIDTIEILDSDDEHPTAMKAIPMKTAATALISESAPVNSNRTSYALPYNVTNKTITTFSDTSTRPVKVESSAEKMASSSNEAVKDKDGRYIVTKKVKVDSIENLQEVPARWPITPEGTNTAYVIDLNNDKKWQELDPNGKIKHLNRFIKQEVCPNIFMSLKLSKPYIILGSRFLGEGDQRFNQSSDPHPIPWKSPHPPLGSSMQWSKTL
jgi:hypothetical protein